MREYAERESLDWCWDGMRMLRVMVWSYQGNVAIKTTIRPHTQQAMRCVCAGDAGMRSSTQTQAPQVMHATQPCHLYSQDKELMDVGE